MGAARVLKPVSLADDAQRNTRLADNAQRNTRLEEYLRTEPDAKTRREYVRLLQAEGPGCRAFIGDMRLDIGDVQDYPDVMLVRADDPDPYQKRHPCVVEALSPSTRDTDLLEKRLAYTEIERLQLYLILEPQHPKAIGYSRTPEGFKERHWEGEGTVEVPYGGISLELSELYQNL